MAASTPPADDEPRSSSAPPAPSVAQLRLYQTLTVLFAIALLGGVGYYFYRQRSIQPVSVLVNGNPVTTVQNIGAANGLIAQVLAAKAGTAYASAGKPEFKQTLTLKRVPDAVALDTPDAASQKLTAATQVTVLADVIFIGKKPFVALPDRDTAQATLDAVRDHYVKMPPLVPADERPTFLETVQIERERVPTTLTKASAQDAAPPLWTPPPAKTYQVKRGETGWSVARKFHLVFADFLRANSGANINRLAPGDSVNVSRSFPPLTVIVKKSISKSEPIVPGMAASAAGLRRVTLEATYVNGELQGNPTTTDFQTLQPASIAPAPGGHLFHHRRHHGF
jgi:LysM repeat protein